jgi:hypothetical protein
MERSLRSPTLSPTSWWIARIFWFFVMTLGIIVLILVFPKYLAGWPVILVEPGFDDSPQIFIYQLIASLASFSCALLSLGLALILFIRRGRERMALFVSFYLIFYGIVMGGPLEAIAYTTEISMNVSVLLQSVLITVPTIILFSTFPNGRFIPVWSRWVIVSAIALNFLILIRPDLDWVSYSSLYTQVVAVLIAILFILAIYAQIYRFRNESSQAERQQTKWVLAGFMLWILWLIISMYPWLYIQSLPPGEPYPSWTALTTVGWWLSLTIIPISLTIAILRYRLFDIDVIIRRTLLYTLLTLFLILTFFGTVLILQGLLRSVSRTDSPITIVISTLTIAALFNPLRHRIQVFIDRQFYRSKYDAEHALSKFAQTARDEVDQEKLTHAMNLLVQETMQPEAISLWITELSISRVNDEH